MSSFNPGNLECVGFAGGFTLWHYDAIDTLMEDILSPNYFNDDSLSMGDVIWISARDGGKFMYVLSANEKDVVLSPM